MTDRTAVCPPGLSLSPCLSLSASAPGCASAVPPSVSTRPKALRCTGEASSTRSRRRTGSCGREGSEAEREAGGCRASEDPAENLVLLSGSERGCPALSHWGLGKGTSPLGVWASGEDGDLGLAAATGAVAPATEPTRSWAQSPGAGHRAPEAAPKHASRRGWAGRAPSEGVSTSEVFRSDVPRVTEVGRSLMTPTRVGK